MNFIIQRLRSSVQYKIGAVMLAAVLVASLVNAWHCMQSTSAALTEAAKNDLASSVASQSKGIEAKLGSAAADLNFLWQIPPVQGYRRAIDNRAIAARFTTGPLGRQAQRQTQGHDLAGPQSPVIITNMFASAHHLSSTARKLHSDLRTHTYDKDNISDVSPHQPTGSKSSGPECQGQVG